MIAFDEVHIWQIDLTLPQPAAWTASLDAAEQARAARFATPALQLAFRRAHGALRAVLAHYTHCSPADLAFTQSRWGKPALTTGELEFNLSHSGALALLAVAPAGCPVGIDIESLEQHRLDVATLFDLTCHDSEKAALLALSGNAQRHAFMALWTRKEAYLKALGIGLQAELREVTFSQHAQIGCWGVAGQATRDNAPWQVRMLETAAGYVGSICLPDAGMRITRIDMAGILS